MERIEKTLLSKTKLVKRLVAFEEISSTNSEAVRLAQEGQEEGTAIVARVQKRGKGRFERVWESPEGGLYLSLILRPGISPDKITLISLMAALAVYHTLENYGVTASIKWPNDVRVKGKKVAGILLESEIKGGRIDYVVLGIGVNVNLKMEALSESVRSSATSLSKEIGKNVNLHTFLEKLLVNLDRYYNLIKEDPFSIIEEWRRHSDTLGKEVIIETPKKIVGKAIDIDDSGFLIVKSNSKKIKVSAGDCIYIEK